MKMLKNLFFVCLSLAVFASCNDDEDKAPKNTSRVQVAIKTSARTLKSSQESPLKLEKLYINIAEIEFDINDEMEDLLPENDTVFTDVKLKGPFPLNLLAGDVSKGKVFTTTNIPNATYEEIEFEFDVYKGTNKEFEFLKGNTIYASGTFGLDTDAVKFVIESKEELEIELEYEKEGLVLGGKNTKVFIDLDLGALIENLLQTASDDFLTADYEEDGSILISKDKNKTILKKFENALEDAFEALEEAHEKNN